MNYDTMTIDELSKLFIEKVKEKVKLEEVTLKELNKEIALLDTVLTNKMSEKSVDKLQIDGLELETIIDESFSINTGNWDDPRWYQWLRDNNYGGLIQTKESVHHQTRTAFLKKLNEEGKELPDFISINPWEHIKYNKSEIKRRILNEN